MSGRGVGPEKMHETARGKRVPTQTLRSSWRLAANLAPSIPTAAPHRGWERTGGRKTSEQALSFLLFLATPTTCSLSGPGIEPEPQK